MAAGEGAGGAPPSDAAITWAPAAAGQMRLGGPVDDTHAIVALEHALAVNPNDVEALSRLGPLYKKREDYSKALECFQRLLQLDNTNGDAWACLGFCYLMMDALQKSYASYQQALYHTTAPKDPYLWYGIGLLYERHYSLEQAEEAFMAVLQAAPAFEHAAEVTFRLGVLAKHQRKYSAALQFFNEARASPPPPLTPNDILFHIGHTMELAGKLREAKDVYCAVLESAPTSAKVLQQLGWLHYKGSDDYVTAAPYLQRAVDLDPTNAQGWYLLGRCLMALKDFQRAFGAFQAAINADPRDAALWCSLGVLYYQLYQYGEALDAFSQAINLDAGIAEVWYNVGTLYDTCGQPSDALAAYERAAACGGGNAYINETLNAARRAAAGMHVGIGGGGRGGGPGGAFAQPMLGGGPPAPMVAGMWGPMGQGMMGGGPVMGAGMMLGGHGGGGGGGGGGPMGMNGQMGYGAAMGGGGGMPAMMGMGMGMGGPALQPPLPAGGGAPAGLALPGAGGGGGAPAAAGLSSPVLSGATLVPPALALPMATRHELPQTLPPPAPAATAAAAAPTSSAPAAAPAPVATTAVARGPSPSPAVECGGAGAAGFMPNGGGSGGDVGDLGPRSGSADSSGVAPGSSVTAVLRALAGFKAPSEAPAGRPPAVDAAPPPPTTAAQAAQLQAQQAQQMLQMQQFQLLQMQQLQQLQLQQQRQLQQADGGALAGGADGAAGGAASTAGGAAGDARAPKRARKA